MVKDVEMSEAPKAKEAEVANEAPIVKSPSELKLLLIAGNGWVQLLALFLWVSECWLIEKNT